jgi:hypothetical protein
LAVQRPGPGGFAGATERAFDKTHAGSGPQWAAFIDEAEVAGKLGRCFRDLGMPDEAISYLDTSLRRHDESRPRSRAITRLVYATALVQQGHLERACELGLQSIAAIGPLRSERSRAYLGDLRRQLTPYRTEPVVQGFQEQVRGLLDASG